MAHQPPATDEDVEPPSTSALLLRAVSGDSERVSIAEILDALDARAFGLATLIFAIPSCVPMPPGVPTVVGFALLIVSTQMVIGREELWLPGFISKRTFSRTALIGGLKRFAPFLRAVERIAQPRLEFITQGAGTVLIGLLVLTLAIILILPLPPGGNFPPAVACAVLGLGLAERDGLIVLIGGAATVAAMMIVWLVTSAVIDALPMISDALIHLWARATDLVDG